MPNVDKTRVIEALDELCGAVGADAGCALYVGDGDGVLELAASVGHGRNKPPGLMHRLRPGSTATEGPTLVLSLPGSPASFLVLARRSGNGFTQHDSTLARLYLRRLSEAGADVSGHARRSGWSGQLETIQRIAARLTRLASIEEVGATICNETRQVIDYDEAQVLVADGQDGPLRLVAAADNSASKGGVQALPTTGPAGDAIARAAHGGVPVLASDLPDLGPGRDGPWSLLAVPLHFESRVSGLICLLARGADHFDDDDLRLLQILSDQAAVAIENARLLNGRDQVVRELAALLEVSKAAGAASDEVGLARVLAERARRATRTDAAIISRWDDDSTMLRELWREGISDPETRTDVADSPLRRDVLRGGRSVVVHAESADSIFEAIQLRALAGQTLLLLPLNAGGRTIGILELISIAESRHLDESELQAVEAMAEPGRQGPREGSPARAAAERGGHGSRYRTSTTTDTCRSACARRWPARRAATVPSAVLMLDLDKFKPVNDRHGHADGDRVLHAIGATIKAHVRTIDIVARYGGDEFVVLMPDTPPEHAEYVARRVVAGIRQRRHQMSDGSEVAVGVSAGLALYPADGRTSAQILQAADAAMYAAKRSGGTQIERLPPAQIHAGVAAAVAG